MAIFGGKLPSLVSLATLLLSVGLLRVGGQSASDHFFCGMGWTDADNNCHLHCPNGVNSDCASLGPNFECFADTSCTAEQPPSPPSPPTPTPPVAVSGSDSRLIAYLGNWHNCPTEEQTRQYTHIVVAFAVSYQWSSGKNICDTDCNIGSPVPTCGNQVRNDLIQKWQSEGKKVILSFGGAGMGGSWAGDVNDCWDYCLDKVDHVVNQLTEIVSNQGFDGVDLDYEYFVDTALQQTFLRDVTTKLKGAIGDKIVTHAPMEPDLDRGDPYYNVLRGVASSLDFVMPQYYNGFSRPALDGVKGTGAGSVAAFDHYQKLVEDMFDGDATKVVFGFCIGDCSGTGSNANAQQAVTVMDDLAVEYPCNGGGFFWVVDDDGGGSWSETVWSAIEPSSGCSTGETAAPQKAPTAAPIAVTSAPTPSPTILVTPEPTAAPQKAPTASPIAATSSPTPSPTILVTAEPTMGSPGLGMYCGTSWSDAKDRCQSTMPCSDGNATVCALDEECYANIPCEDVSTSSPTASSTTASPTVSPTVEQTTEEPTSSPTQATDSPTPLPDTESPTSSPTNSPTSPPETESPTSSPTKSPTSPPETSSPTNSPTSPPETASPTSSPTTGVVPTASPTILATTTSPTTGSGGDPIESHEPRCGYSEVDAREYCRETCQSERDCRGQMRCYNVNVNYCGSIIKPVWVDPQESTVTHRCGTSEVDAREFCRPSCTHAIYCDASRGESCIGVHRNYCDSAYETSRYLRAQ